ncbi:MAG: transcriptional regulator, partial [Actinomycetota bacterium]
MTEPVARTLARAREAITLQAWSEAFELLTEADRLDQLDADGLTMLADAAYLAGSPGSSRAATERLYVAHLARGDNNAAAAAAARVAGLLLEEGLMSPLRAWATRARGLLENDPDSTVHGTLANVMMWAAIASGDGEAALAEARRAIEVGTHDGEPAIRALGLNGEGRALILLGQIQEGLALLDESTVAAMSGELDPISTAALFCSTVCALQALAEYDRAEEWTRVMERWVEEHAVGPFRGWCRVHRAEILRLRGQWRDAEGEARRGFEEVRSVAGIDRGWPLTEMANIRLRTGDLQGAEEAFIQARELGWEPQPGLALLRLARRDVRGAADEIKEALEHPPEFTGWERPPNSHLRRAPLLAAQVEIATAGGDLELADCAAEELENIAETLGTTAIRAAAASSRGVAQLARGNMAEARRSLEAGTR